MIVNIRCLCFISLPTRLLYSFPRNYISMTKSYAAQLYRDNFTEWVQQINPIYMDEQIPLLITLTVYFLPIPESVTLIALRMRHDGRCDQPYLSEAATLM